MVPSNGGGDMREVRLDASCSRAEVREQGAVYGVLAASMARGEHALETVRIFAVVVQQTAQSCKRGEALVSRTRVPGQLSGER